MHLNRSHGQALTEFILVFPLFLAIVLGVVQFSLLYLAFQVVHYASFSAARAAIVRPCTVFHPDHYPNALFSSGVFSAAAFSNLVAAPPQPLFGLSTPYVWMPAIPNSLEVIDLDYRDLGSDMELPGNKLVNATYLTAVQRVWKSSNGRPVVWEACEEDDPCEVCAIGGISRQSVPPPGSDITLEVTFVYPLIIPFVNRVIYGVFANFSELATDLGIAHVVGSGSRPEEEAMVLPLERLPARSQYLTSRGVAVNQIFANFGYSSASIARSLQLLGRLQAKGWYLLPIRARCTLTVTSSTGPMIP